MIQALQAQGGSLPQGLTVQNTYTKLWKGSKKAVVVVWNNTAYPQTLQKKTPMARVVAASPVPESPEGEKLQEKAGKSHNSHTPVLTVRQRHGKLFDELDLSSLDLWTLELADAACQLLAKYHNVFSLDPAELGCTHSTEHIIKVTDNIVVLVWKKDGGLHFCIGFCHLNAHTKKDSYPLPRIQQVLESLVGAGHFSCLDLKSGFWQIKMEEMSKQYTAFMVGNLGFFECDRMPFGLCNAPVTFQ